MKQFTKYICVFLMMAGMSVSAWGETITITYDYNSDYNDMWDGDMDDASTYWKITGTATFSIPIAIQPTSNITISIKMAYAGAGTEGLEKISASGTETSSNWTMGETSACSHEGSDYSTCNFTITKNATPTTLEGLDITLDRKYGKNLRVQKIQVSYTSADVPTIVLTRSGSPVTSIDFGTITSAGTDEWTFDLSSFCTGMDSYDYCYYYLTLDDDAVFYESDDDDYYGYIFSDETQFKIGYVVESPGTYEATLNIEAYKTKSCGGNYDGEAFSIDIPITITYSSSCSTSPTVTAGSNSSVTSTTATISCSSGISSLGSAGCSISSYGFVIGTATGPAIDGSGVTKHEVGTTYASTGASFSKDLTGLSPNTTYYVRPYATNGNGTAYGTQTSFTTLQRYAITYYKNDGGATSDVEYKDHGISYTISSNKYSRDHYTLVKWHTLAAGTGGTDYAKGATYSTNAILNLYAVWGGTISFNNNGGTGSMSSEVAVNGSSYSLPSCTFTPPAGKAFKCWAQGAADGTERAVGYSHTVSGNITFYADWRDVVYTDYKFSCADWELTGPSGDIVFITSTASKTVRSQEAFHVTGTGLPHSTALTFTISPSTAASKFAFKKADGTSLATDTYGAINTDFYVYYTPGSGDTSDGLDDFTSLTVSVTGEPRTATIDTKRVIGRHLPADFVIAGKKDGKWYALPSNMASTTNPKPSEIAVDDINNPSIAYTAASNIYTMEGPTSNNISSGKGQYIRFVMTPLWVDDADHTKGHAPLFGSATGTRTIGKSGNSQATSDLESGGWWWKLEQKRTKGLSNPQDAIYTIYNHNNTSSLSLRDNAGNPDWGLFASGVEELRLIPASAVEYTASEVVAWGQKKLILEVAKPDLATQARAKIGDGSWSAYKSLATTTGTSKGTATKYNYTLDFTSDDFDFAAHEDEMLIVELHNAVGSALKATSVIIPRIVATNTTINKSNYTLKTPWNTEVHVLPGVTLTLDASAYDPQDMTFKELNIYPGATVVAEKGTLKATTLILRNGWDRLSATKTYDVARLYITPTNGSLNATTAYADWYIDFDQYYPIAVPWEVDLGENDGSTICYKNTKTKAIIGLSTTVRLRYYDGASRAKGLGDASKRENWKHYGESGCEDIPDKLEPSKAYAMTAKRPTGKAFSIIRLPLTIPTTTWTTGGEKGSVTAGEPAVTTHKDQVTVTAYNNDEGNAAKWARGWNFIANPYMSLYQGPITHSAGSGYNVEYANIPDVNFNEYEQYPIGTDLTKLKPASGFLIQTEADGTLTFNTDNRKASAPSYRTEEAPKASKQKAYILLSDQEANDMMGLIISDQYTAEYEMNADLEKLLGDGTSLKTYMRYGEMNMAYVAINETLAKEWIPVSVRIPETGEYTFSIHEASIADELEGVYLIDYQNGDQVTNLLVDSYTFNTTAGTISNRFAINAKVGERETPTAIDVVGMDKDSKEPIKFLWHDKVFIWFNGVIYDATGKKVR